MPVEQQYTDAIQSTVYSFAAYQHRFFVFSHAKKNFVIVDNCTFGLA